MADARPLPDRNEPPHDDAGLLAVEDAYARILERRNPGTTWVSGHRAQDPGAPLSHAIKAWLVPEEANDDREKP